MFEGINRSVFEFTIPIAMFTSRFRYLYSAFEISSLEFVDRLAASCYRLS